MIDSSNKSRPAATPKIPQLLDEMALDLAAFMSPLVATTPEYVTSPQAAEQLPVLFWLSENLRPRVVVDVGATDATVYFGICQAVGALSIETRCFLGDPAPNAGSGKLTIDHWLRHQNLHHPHRSRIVRGETDDLGKELGEVAVDLLILHLENATSEQLQRWKKELLPRVASDGVIVLDGLGSDSHEIYEELKAGGPAFRFLHGTGFAVTAQGKSPPALVRYLGKQEKNPADATLVRSIFKQLGLGCRQPTDVQEIALKNTDVPWAARLVNSEAQIEELYRQLEWYRDELESARGKAELSSTAPKPEDDLVAGLHEAERRLRASCTEIGSLRRAHDEEVAELTRCWEAKITDLREEFKRERVESRDEIDNLQVRIADLGIETRQVRDEAESLRSTLLDELAELTRISEEWRSRANHGQTEAEQLLFKLRMQRRARHKATAKLRSRARLLAKELSRARNETETWKTAVANLEEQVRNLLSSTSWRVTKPLRGLKRVLTRPPADAS